MRRRWNSETAWAKHLVNLNQTPAERKAKYLLVLRLGGTPNDARQMRDWREAKIKRAYGIQ